MVEKKMELAEVSTCESRHMLSRMWNVADTNGDGCLVKRELEESVFGPLLSGEWHQLDEDSDGKITIPEWFQYWDSIEGELGEGGLRNMLGEMLYEADVDVKVVST